MTTATAGRLLPPMRWFEQPVATHALTDDEIRSTIQIGVAHLEVVPGSTVAVAVGSRGIANIVLVVRTVISALRARGVTPFVFPAMGSHGGGTADGQRAVLSSLGITSTAVGCEIRSDMRTVEVAMSDRGIPVRLDAIAAQADGGIVVINRIKPHTHFRGPTESGLSKMMVIGAGKHDQALLMHAHGVAGLRDLVPDVARAMIRTGRVLAGVGLCEDGEHKLSSISVMPGVDIPRLEPELLVAARSMMPRLPVEDLDLLIVDRIGKDISGTGMDTNVVGRVRALDFAAFDAPRIRVVYARSLTEATHGNGIGVGLADLVHRRLVNALDPITTRINAMTGGSPQMGAVPITADSDLQALQMFDRYLRGATECKDLRIVRIRDTLTLNRILISEAIAEALDQPPACEGHRVDPRYDACGDFST